MKVALLGLGLIGGSIARALRADTGRWELAAWSPLGAGPHAALAAGAVDAAPDTARGAVEGAALVVLAAPPTACLALLHELGGSLRPALAPGTVITDVASSKVAVVARADAFGLPFVGGHPMAGRETSGFAAADAVLFRGRPWVIVQGAAATADMTARVELLARACGAVPVRMGAAIHDAAVAGVSHLPLVLAAALVEAVAGGPGEPDAPGWEEAAALAAGGWQSATRLALGDAAMGAGIAVTNAAPIGARLRELRSRLDEWLALLDPADHSVPPDEVAGRFDLGVNVRYASAKEVEELLAIELHFGPPDA